MLSRESISKNNHASQVLIPLIQQIAEAISSGQICAVVIADLEETSDGVWRNDAICKL